jgi:amino acid transporter
VESQASDRKPAEEQEQSESLSGVSSLANGSSPTVPAETGIDRVATSARKVRQPARSRAKSPIVSRGNR